MGWEGAVMVIRKGGGDGSRGGGWVEGVSREERVRCGCFGEWR